MLLIHDLDTEYINTIESLFPSNTKIVSKEMNNIHPCLGCFKCWVKTPGKCIINDSYTEMPKYFKENDKVIVLTELKFGSYSPYIKRVIERSIGFLLPFFRIINGEMHHTIRYKEIPKLIFIGYSNSYTPDDEKTFKNLVKGNAINFGSDQYESYIAKDINELETIIKKVI